MGTGTSKVKMTLVIFLVTQLDQLSQNFTGEETCSPVGSFFFVLKMGFADLFRKIKHSKNGTFKNKIFENWNIQKNKLVLILDMNKSPA